MVVFAAILKLKCFCIWGKVQAFMHIVQENSACVNVIKSWRWRKATYVDTNVVYPYLLVIRQWPLLVSWDNYLTISSIHSQLKFYSTEKGKKAPGLIANPWIYESLNDMISCAGTCMMHYIQITYMLFISNSCNGIQLTANLPLDNGDISGIHYLWDLQNVYLYYY